MSTLLEDYVKEAAEEAAKEATEKVVIEMGKEMLREGIDLKSVTNILQEKLDISEVEAEKLLRG